MLRIAATADESFAAIFERSKFGITIAAMIKMMVTTIRSSTSEKPFCGLFIVTLPNVNVSFQSRQTESSPAESSPGKWEHFTGHFSDGSACQPTEFPKITWNHSKGGANCAVSKIFSLAYCSQQSRAKNKEEAKLPPLCRWLA